MKRLLAVLVLYSCIMIVGCSRIEPGTTLIESPEEREFRISQITDLQTMMITDDWDRIWLLNASSPLSYWGPNVGF